MGQGVNPPDQRRNQFVESFAKGLTVIRAFDSDHRMLTLGEVGERTGQSRASARRFLLTLHELGYVRTEGDRFALTPRIVELGHRYLLDRSLGDTAQPIIEPLARQLGETASVGVLADEAVEIVAYARGPRQMSLNLAPGDRLPLFSSAQGRALLMGMSEDAVLALFQKATIEPLSAKTKLTLDDNLEAIAAARSAGHVLMDEELEVGVRSIAVPVRRADGAVIGAMSTCAHANRASSEELIHRFKPLLVDAVQTIERALGAAESG